MTTFSRVLLSGSTSGRAIPVAATATPGTLIHTAVSGAVSWDEVYVWASNVTGAAATLTIEWGGVTDPGDHIVKAVSIPANSAPVPILLGHVLNGGLVVRAFSGTASALNITGYVNRIA
jgi:hypothetical protein